MVADIDKAKLEPRHFEARRFLRILLLFFLPTGLYVRILPFFHSLLKVNVFKRPL